MNELELLLSGKLDGESGEFTKIYKVSVEKIGNL